MYRQETILYKDTYNIHITKDYVDNILIEEIHYNRNNRIIYKNNIECEVKYFYDVNVKYELQLSKNIKQENILRKITQDTKNFGSEKHYIINDNTCTYFCTMNNHDAIKYIKEYIKTYILKSNNLI
jgi:hypothetical protein